jgi:hypothetical protein
MGLGQNGHDFNVNGLVHIHGGTVTLPREVHMTRWQYNGDMADKDRTGSAFAQSCRQQRNRSTT